MQITRNQHYVPQFYMKFFSNVKNERTKKEKALISFYQFKDNLFRDNIKTDSVCSENYFYDEDGKIENKLAEKENKWARIINKIICNESLTISDNNGIREFIIYQILRTKGVLEHNQAMATTVLTDIINTADSSMNKSLIQEIIEEEVEKDVTAEYNLSLVEKILHVIDDLSIEILENKTEVNFITSDVPVIIINPLGIFRAGLGEIGTTIFLPISPRKMLMLYDYRLFGNLVKEIKNIECINAFNKYQYISADERILAFNSKEFKELVEDKELNTFREEFLENVKTTATNVGAGRILATKSRSIEYCIDIPILKLPKSLKKIPVEFRDTVPRKYSYETRLNILHRVYKDDDFVEEEHIKEHWKKIKKHSKEFLKYLDYYWKTPKEDLIITGETMQKLKKVKIDYIPIKG